MAKRRERVTKVIDGDTFKTAARKRSVRLANVDAPEKGQPGGAKATRDLKSWSMASWSPWMWSHADPTAVTSPT